MKAKNSFEEVLLQHLEGHAKQDKQFADKFSTTTKTLGGCVGYIFTEAKKQAINYGGNSCAPIKDDEVFGWAVHFFWEDSIKENATPIRGSVMMPNNNKPGDMSLAMAMTLFENVQ